MFKTIFLDSSPLGLITKAAKTSEVQSILQWTANCLIAGHQIIIPEITDYEVRRELIRSRKINSLIKLDNLKSDFIYLPLTTLAMQKAATLWAQTRQQGQPTSHDENIDVDVILAAQALSFDAPDTQIIVATSNLRHLSRLITADLWQNIAP